MVSTSINSDDLYPNYLKNIDCRHSVTRCRTSCGRHICARKLFPCRNFKIRARATDGESRIVVEIDRNQGVIIENVEDQVLPFTSTFRYVRTCTRWPRRASLTN